MNDSNKWDWTYMYYCATVLLGMSEREFWRLTPRKINALMKKYTELNCLSKEQTNEEAFGQLMQM